MKKLIIVFTAVVCSLSQSNFSQAGGCRIVPVDPPCHVTLPPPPRYIKPPCHVTLPPPPCHVTLPVPPVHRCKITVPPPPTCQITPPPPTCTIRPCEHHILPPPPTCTIRPCYIEPPICVIRPVTPPPTCVIRPCEPVPTCKIVCKPVCHCKHVCTCKKPITTPELPHPVPHPQPTLPEVEAGREVTIDGRSFGYQTGSVIVQFGTLQLPAQVTGWTGNQVRAVIPNLPMTTSTPARVAVFNSNGQVAEQLDVMMMPQNTDSRLALR